MDDATKLTQDDLDYACTNDVQNACLQSGAIRLGNLVPRMAGEILQLRRLVERSPASNAPIGGWQAIIAAQPRPLVGLSVLVVKHGKLLLGKRRGSHGDGEYAAPGGHLEHLESFQVCAEREVLEETGIEIGPLRFLRVLNATQYAPKHYVDLAFVAEWCGGEPEVREPDKVDRWDWYAIDDLPSPLFAMLPSAIASYVIARPALT